MSARTSPRSVTLTTLEDADRTEWLERMQSAFAAGLRDAGLKPGDEPIPDIDDMDEVLRSPGAEALQIVCDGGVVGGAVVSAESAGRRSLELFFIDSGLHGGGIGAAAWTAIEERYPGTRVWETETPYFDQRNIHFYINRCGFRAVEFFHPGHRPEDDGPGDHPGPERSFRFEKVMGAPC